MPDMPHNPLTAKLDIPNMPGLPGYMPKELDWKNIKDIWKFIEDARESRDPEQWEEAVSSIKVALENWRRAENKWADLIKKLRIAQAVAKRAPEGEKRQKALDTIENLREMMPPSIRKIADQPEGTFVSNKVTVIDQLIHQLEGIRQGDFDSFHADVQNRIRKWQLELEQEQELIKKKIVKLNEVLFGVKDEKKREAIGRRINDLTRELDATEIPDRISVLKKEISSLYRRLTGATTEAGRAKIQERIDELKTELKTPEEMMAASAEKTDEMKYDALMWLATIVAHPIKVIKTRRSPGQQSLSAPYMPHRRPEEEEQPPMPPPAGPAATECQIFFSMIREGRYETAKAFCLDPYVIDEGSLVELEGISNPVLNRLKGRVRLVTDRLVVDLFKNDAVTESAVSVALYEAKPYLI